MKKEFNNNGKGKRPIIGYNPKNWYANFDLIRWDNKKCDCKYHERQVCNICQKITGNEKDNKL